MYELQRAKNSMCCEACGAHIQPGIAFGRSHEGGAHCGQCAIRFGAAELRACLESIRDRVSRVS